MEIPMDTSNMSEQELQFHYFKMHDADKNGKLDGCELVKSLIHWHGKKLHQRINHFFHNLGWVILLRAEGSMWCWFLYLWGCTFDVLLLSEVVICRVMLLSVVWVCYLLSEVIICRLMLLSEVVICYLLSDVWSCYLSFEVIFSLWLFSVWAGAPSIRLILH